MTSDSAHLGPVVPLVPVVPVVSEFRSITKRFPGVLALDDVSVAVERGSCHALCGENGAGKSTLAKVLAGIHQPDAGELRIDGVPVRFGGPTDALAAGIAMVHQELSFCENLSVAENLCLGRMPRRGGVVDRAATRRRAEAHLAAIGASLDVDRPVGELTIAQQQLVQIAAALGRGARVVIFDEPTSSLSQHEADRLYELIAALRARGVTCLYVSHRLEEVFRLADTITVLRDGRHVATQPAASLDRAALVELMIGRRLDEYFPAHVQGTPGDEILRVDGLSAPSGFADVSFVVRAGEVVGCAGLVGAGRSEVARAIFGVDPRAAGRVFLRGTPIDPGSAADAIALGIGLVPEDRKRQGLVPSMSVRANGALSVIGRHARLGIVTRTVEDRIVAPWFSRLGVRAKTLDAPVAALSGGNQQKVVLTKWLAARCSLLIIDEPTRGVDVGAKAEIHALVDELAANGTAILLISSEMPEILHLSTRILVFRDGRIAGELSRAQATQDRLMRLMAGVESVSVAASG
ncbi:MAG: sugar ABC transporter ATP-binding protein [Acidobacteria bacterium]|nr:sugar ABC transporter ATP-binding protein [Acidobacteriota bacterium]